MKRHIYQYLSLSLIFCSIVMHAADPSAVVTPKFTIRSQGSNVPRRILGSIGKRDLYGIDNDYWTFSLTPEFTDSFDSGEIAQCLFGDSLCDEHFLKIEGSRVQNRDSNALLADYFYLPTDFQSIIEFEPRIRNFLVDINFYYGLDNCLHGMYFWLQAPVTWTQWNLDYKERIISPGVNGYDEGYFTPNALDRSELLNSFTQFAVGGVPGSRNQAGAGVITQTIDFAGQALTADTLFQPLRCAKLCPNKQTDTALSELRFALGWNFLLCEDYHVGVNLQVSAPTGNKVESEFLFSPQNGNDHHWELGVGITAHYLICQSEDEASHFGIYLDANLTHMFKNEQRRCFDLCGKPLSRYMLAARVDDVNVLDLEGNGVLADALFSREFTPVANITTFDVDVSVGVNADIALWFNYTCGGWSWDFGYNFWARSCEKIRFSHDDCDPCDLNIFEENTWVLKGDSQMFGFMSENEGPGVNDLLLNDPVPLSASMSTATINGGNNFGRTGVTQAQIAAGRANPGIDFPQPATATEEDIVLNTQRTTNPAFAALQINTSIQPVFIKQEDINFARIKGISSKLFYGITYTWLDQDECDWVPYAGTGFEVEWASNMRNNNCDDDCNTSCDDTSCGRKNDCDNDCDDDCDDNKTFGDCVKCGLSQWGVMARFGVSFN